jgi:hypothetical protein
MNSGLGLEFIDRAIRTTGVVLLIFFPFGLYYMGFYPSLAVFSGGIWGILNFMLITGLVKAAIRFEGAHTPRVIVLALVKFPLLYVSGYFLLKISYFQPLHLLIGFSSILAIVVLKAVGRLLVSAKADQTGDSKSQGAAAV